MSELHHPIKLREFEKIDAEVAKEIKVHQAERLRRVHESLVAQSIFFSESKRRLSVHEDLPSDYQPFFASFAALFHEGRAGRISARQVKARYVDLRVHAISEGWFEALREIDLHYARIFKKSLLPLVKMATRHAHYQYRYLADVRYTTAYFFSRLDRADAFRRAGAFQIKSLPTEPKLRALFILLFSEQYAPVSVFTIWETLVPDEYFYEPHSTNRVHQWIKRLKAWLKTNEIPATICSERAGYRLISMTTLACDADLLNAQSETQAFLQRLRKRFQLGTLFSIHEAAECLTECSIREVQYRVKELIELKQILKHGKARSVRYSWVG